MSTPTPTLVFRKPDYVNGRIAYYPGDEVPPGTFSQETIDRALDEGYLVAFEDSDRRSLYRLLHRFSGVAESEQLKEKENLCL